MFDFEKGELLLVDKELGWTSFDVIKSVRNSVLKSLKKKKFKVGHAGTLDPLATGLLIICTGKLTKKIDEYQGADKVYTGIITLGAETPSCDLETEIINRYDISQITDNKIYETAKKFEGVIEQAPPVFSAIRIEGKRAYEFARENKEVEMKTRPITINSFKITKVELPDVHFEVSCSKGTYIRSLARDFGKALNNGAYLKELRRTMIGNFSVDDALSVKKVKELIDFTSIDSPSGS